MGKVNTTLVFMEPEATKELVDGILCSSYNNCVCKLDKINNGSHTISHLKLLNKIEE